MTQKEFNLVSKLAESAFEWGTCNECNTRDYFGSAMSMELPEDGQYLYIFIEEGDCTDWQTTYIA